MSSSDSRTAVAWGLLDGVPAAFGIGAMVWVGGYALATAVLQGSEEALRILADVAYLLPFFLALGLSIAAARRSEGRQRAFWAILAVALMLSSAGDVYWSAIELPSGKQIPFPGLYDVFYLSSVIVAIAAIVIGFGQTPSRIWRALLDGSVLAVAVGYAGFVLLIEPQLGGDTLKTAVSIAYPLLDIMLLALLGSIAFVGHRRVPLAVMIVGLAYAVAAVADAGYTYLTSINEYASGSWLDIGWQIQAVLLCVAAATSLRAPAGQPEERRIPRDLALVPVLAGAAVTLAVFVVQALHGGIRLGEAALMTYVIAAVVHRLYLLSRENARIARDLEHAVAEQERLAVTDDLTGLRNRRYFEASLEHDVERAVRAGRSLGLLLLDLDRFKRVNDGHGHLAGDRVLAEVATRLSSAVRGGDVVARHGGEEFVVLLPDADREVLLEVAERCRRQIGDRPFDLGDTEIALTASVGGAVFPADAADPEQLQRIADQAMYRAKAYGRDRVEVGTDPAWSMDDLEEITAALPWLRKLADGGDPSSHPRTVARLAGAVADALGLDREARRRCVTAADFHDLGKVWIPPQILSKPGPLTEDEWKLVRGHPQEGARMLSLVPELRDVASIVRDHHEWFNGDGYPAGKSGGAIPVEARIVAVCDAWDAMRSERPYRDELTLKRARAELVEGAGTQFDPRVVKAFVLLLDRGDLPLDAVGEPRWGEPADRL